MVSVHGDESVDEAPGDTLAYLFAAGMSQRLGAAGDGKPKSLLRVGDRRLVEHHLSALVDLGIRRIAIVVGYRAEEYRATLGDAYRDVPLHYIVNERYRDDGQIRSLLLGREFFTGPTILVNADVFCPPAFYRLLLASPRPNLMLLDARYPVLTGDEVVICGSSGRVRALVLGTAPDARGEFVGLNKFGSHFLTRWCDFAETTFDDRWRGANYEWVLNGFLDELGRDRANGHDVVGYTDVRSRQWVNVNYPNDLLTAGNLARARERADESAEVA